MLVIFLSSLIPIAVLALYNYPCADDFSASDTVHLAWVNTGSIFAVLKAAWGNVVYNYLEWSGVFMSVFWTSLQFGIFGEKYYGIVTLFTIVFLLVGGFYLGHVIFDKYIKADKYLSRSLILLYLFISIQCMPDGNEGMYWHAGVVNYTWAFAFLLMLLGITLSIHIENNVKIKVIKVLLACVLAVCVGGGNFITALQGSIWMATLVAFVVIIGWLKEGRTLQESIKANVNVMIPAMVVIAAFAASVLAPGNKVRIASTTGFGAVKAILVSFYYTLTDPFEKWIAWPIFVIVALAVPFMWQMVKNTQYSYRYPGIVALLGFCFVSAAYTPSLYAQGEAGAGRQDNTVFLIWTIILFAVVFYFLGWVKCNLGITKEATDCNLNQKMKLYIAGVITFWFVFTGLTVMIDEDTYIGTHAGFSIVTGQAKQYREENEQRLELLKSEEKNIVFTSFSNPPELLIFEDIYENPEEWLNQVMAEYYGKESVRREEGIRQKK